MASQQRRVVILGGGFSGAAAALHLSRRSPGALHISVIEPRADLGMGIAHGTPEIHNRLNGTDAIHSPYPESPQDFAEWMRRSGELAGDPDATTPKGLTFPRRGAFGRYMAAEVAAHARHNPSHSRIDHVRQRAQRLLREREGVRIELADGRHLVADDCLLALGWNAVATPRELSGLAGHDGWLADPWQTARLDALAPDAPVLLIGTGLTACDTFAALKARGHKGPVTALSRRGLRPASQNPFRSNRSIWERIQDSDPALFRQMSKPRTVRAAMRDLRELMASVDVACSSWHTPFDDLRDSVSHFWPDWPLAEKRRFQRHVKPWWDTFRFRNPPQTEAIIDEALASGQLQFVGGRLSGAETLGDGLRIHYRSRHDHTDASITVSAVVNCTGPNPRPSASANPLWQNLIAEGLARDSATGSGIDVDAQGRLRNQKGEADPRLQVIGPPTIGQYGEVIAVPYIVGQILAWIDREFSKN